MKKTFYILTYLICVNHSYGQLIATWNPEIVKQLPSKKLQVMLIGKNPYDDAVKEAVKSNWTVSSYDFKTKEEIEKELSDKTLSFLLPLEISAWSDGTTLINFALTIKGIDDTKSLCLFNGGACKKIVNLKSFSIAAEAPFDNFSYEQDLNLAAYRLGLIIKNFNDYILLVNQDKIPLVRNENTAFKFMNAKAPALKEKTLLVNEELLKNKNEKGNLRLMKIH